METLELKVTTWSWFRFSSGVRSKYLALSTIELWRPMVKQSRGRERIIIMANSTRSSECIERSTRLIFGRVFGLWIACLLLFAIQAGAIGVNIGEIADNLLPPDQILALVKSTIITKAKLFAADPAILNAFAGSEIEVIIGAGNDQIGPLAQQDGYAMEWLNTNVVPFSNTKINAITVGNEVLAYAANAADMLLPAMTNLHSALVSIGLDDRIKVGTPSALSVLEYSAPPSNSSFRAWEASILGPMMPFLASTGAPFMVNLYPYFAYIQEPENTFLNFVLFEPKVEETRFDDATKLVYTSMWDSQLDAVYTAIAKLGFENVSVLVTETGWPHDGDEYQVGPSLTSAQTFISNLVERLEANKGTPLRPEVPVEAYIFDLFDEDLKDGAGSERHFGLFYANGTPVFDVGIVPPAALPFST
ncbi:unnamed protein product [Calypogeia fissa]